MWCRDEAAALMAPVEPLDVEIGEGEVLLPAGMVSSMLEGTIVVQVCPDACLRSCAVMPMWHWGVEMQHSMTFQVISAAAVVFLHPTLMVILCLSGHLEHMLGLDHTHALLVNLTCLVA